MMKRYKYKVMLRLLTGLFVLLAGSFSFLSCMDEQELTGGGTGDTEETVVRFTITTPGTTTPRATSRSGVDTEYGISDIRVLIFALESGKYTFKYMVEGEQLTLDETDGRKTNFIARLKTSLSPIKIVMAANAKDAFETYVPPVGMDEDEVRKKMVTGFQGDAPAVLPMYGEKSLLSLDATTNHSLTVKMLRAVARVDVEVDLDRDNSKEFVLESVAIYRANGEMQLIADGATLSSTETPVVNAPSVPSPVEKLGAYKKKVNTSGEERIEKLYVTESVHTDNPSVDFGQITCVVVGGYYDGGSTPVYYRADFNSGIEGHPYGQILRNHKYLFKVKQVNGAGWQEPDDAANNLATNMVMEIQPWEDFTLEMFVNGDNYLGIAARNVVFAYNSDLKKQVGVQSTVPYRISWVGKEEYAMAGDGAISDDFFSVRIVTRPDVQGDVSYLEFTTLQENTSADKYCSQLLVEWMNWTFIVEVTQLHYKKNASRSVRVFSLHTGATGDLGDWTSTSPNGKGMRQLLSNQTLFSSSGVVSYFTGFSFSRSPNNTWASATNETSQAAVLLRSEVYAADVVYLANGNLCSDYAAKMLLEWLEDSPQRVLIVGGDGSDTSPGLLRSDKYAGFLADDVDWWYTTGSYNARQIHASGKAFAYAPDHNNREFFTEGPFPFTEAELTETFKVPDVIFGYANVIKNKDITPLMYHEAVSAAQPTVAVDKKRRIIYHGDASMYEYTGAGYLSGSGKMEKSQDKFWGNVWAWIVYQVIWGDSELIENR